MAWRNQILLSVENQCFEGNLTNYATMQTFSIDVNSIINVYKIKESSFTLVDVKFINFSIFWNIFWSL